MRRSEQKPSVHAIKAFRSHEQVSCALQATLSNITGGIYSKKAHFLLELVQNADDLSYINCQSRMEEPTLCICMSAQGLSAG